MKVGDLVNFYSSFWTRGYEKRNPGVIIKHKKSVDIRGMDSAVIYWADGSVTSEHFGYLQLVEEDRHESR